MNETINILRTRQNELVDKFRQPIRTFNGAEWRRLLLDYEDAGLEANAKALEARIAGCIEVLQLEHTRDVYLRWIGSAVKHE